MEPTRPKLPSEAIELYNLFIHGVISRRTFMAQVQKFAIGGLAASTILEALMPNYAAAQQVSKTDDAFHPGGDPDCSACESHDSAQTRPQDKHRR